MKNVKKFPRQISRRRRAFTMVETMAGVGITVVTLVAGIGIYMNTMMSWTRGIGAMDSLNNSQNAMRLVGNELREATNVKIDQNGNRVTYVVPTRDANGDYLLPIVNDPTVRYFEVANGNIVHKVGTKSHVIARDVLSVDPDSGSSYKVFSAQESTVVRQITVQIVTSKPGYRDNWEPTRARETISLRNIPQLSR